MFVETGDSITLASCTRRKAAEDSCNGLLPHLGSHLITQIAKRIKKIFQGWLWFNQFSRHVILRSCSHWWEKLRRRGKKFIIRCRYTNASLCNIVYTALIYKCKFKYKNISRSSIWRDIYSNIFSLLIINNKIDWLRK